MTDSKRIAELALTAKRAYVGTTEEQACAAVEELASLVAQAWEEGNEAGWAEGYGRGAPGENPYRRTE